MVAEEEDPSGLGRARQRDQGKALVRKSTLNRRELTGAVVEEAERRGVEGGRGGGAGGGALSTAGRDRRDVFPMEGEVRQPAGERGASAGSTGGGE